MVVKVKDAETKRNKVSVAHTGWNKRKKTSTTTPKKVCLYSSSLQLLFKRKFENQRAIVQQENQIHRVTGLVVWRKEGWWGALLQFFSPLSRSYHVSFSLSFPSSPAYCRFFLYLVVTSLCFALCFHFSPAAKAVAGYTNTNGLFLVLSYALHLLCFRVVLASFTLTTMAVGNTSEGFASVLSPWSIWAHKNSSNGY